MARVRDIEINDVPEDARPIYQTFVEEYGPFLNQVRVFAHRAPALKHIMGLLLELKQEQVIPPRLLEIVLVTVSQLNQCTYCVSHHAPKAIDSGLPPNTINTILQPDAPGLNEVERLVRDYAVAVTKSPYAIRDAMFEQLKQHFSEAQIVELTLRAALCGFFNRFNDALQLEIEDGVLESMLTRGVEPSHLPCPEKAAADAD